MLIFVCPDDRCAHEDTGTKEQVPYCPRHGKEMILSGILPANPVKGRILPGGFGFTDNPEPMPTKDKNKN